MTFLISFIAIYLLVAVLFALQFTMVTIDVRESWKIFFSAFKETIAWPYHLYKASRNKDL